MTTRSALVLLLVLCAAPAAAAKRPRLSVYRSAKLGVEFRYPSGWAHEPCRGVYSAPDCVGFRRRGRRGAGVEYLLRVSVSGRGLEEAALDDGRFQQNGAKWVMTGRLGSEGEVKKVRGRGWEGLFGTAVCGVTVDGSFHGAGGECCAAFLHRRGRTAKIETDGILPPDTVLDTVVRSFRFLD